MKKKLDEWAVQIPVFDARFILARATISAHREVRSEQHGSDCAEVLFQPIVLASRPPESTTVLSRAKSARYLVFPEHVAMGVVLKGGVHPIRPAYTGSASHLTVSQLASWSHRVAFRRSSLLMQRN